MKKIFSYNYIIIKANLISQIESNDSFNIKIYNINNKSFYRFLNIYELIKINFNID